MIEGPPRGIVRAIGILNYIGKMIIFSTIMVAVPGTYALLKEILRNPHWFIDWIPIVSLVLFVFSFMMGSVFRELRLPSVILIIGSIGAFIIWLLDPLSLERISLLPIVFLSYSVFLVGLGYFLSNAYRVEMTLKLEEAIFVVALLWILIPPIVAVPVSLYLGIPFLDTWFESVNGMAGTGLTVFTGGPDHTGALVPTIEELPKPILLWRSFIQWIGGIGIVVFSMAVLSRPGLGVILLSQVEGRLERIEPSIRKTSVQMVKFYIFLTLISFLLLKIAGMSVFDAINHAFTGIATAGFSTKNNSIAGFNSISIEIAAMIVMFIGASNFYDMYKALRKPSFYFKSPEFKFLLSVTIIGTITGSYILYAYGGEDVYTAVRAAAFQVVSGATTTGFQSYNLSNAPTAFKILLTLLMLVGGSVFSTAGGIKIFRILVAFKALKEELRKITGPSGTVVSYRVGRYRLSEHDVVRAVIVIFLFIVFTNLGFIYASIRLAENFPSDNIYFDTVSAMTNIGLSTGVAGAALPADIKLLFMFLSTLGRIEILPMILLFYKLVSSISKK